MPIVVLSAVDLQTDESLKIEADYFIDDTGDGWLAAKAGASFRMGREAKSEFNESVYGKEKADRQTLGCSIYGFVVKRDYPVPFKKPEWAKEYKDCSSFPYRQHDGYYHLSKDGNTGNFFWWLEWGGQLDVIKDSETI